jgi:hypothetical protein
VCVCVCVCFYPFRKHIFHKHTHTLICTQILLHTHTYTHTWMSDNFFYSPQKNLATQNFYAAKQIFHKITFKTHHLSGVIFSMLAKPSCWACFKGSDLGLNPCSPKKTALSVASCVWPLKLSPLYLSFEPVWNVQHIVPGNSSLHRVNRE